MPDAAVRPVRPTFAEPTTARRWLSAGIAILARFAGLGLVFAGGANVASGIATNGLAGHPNWLLIAGGLVLLAVAASTLLLSTLGLLIVSTVEILLGFVGLLVPFSASMWDLHPANWLNRAYGFVLPGSGDQAAYSIASGFLLVFGAVSLATAFGIGGRRRAQGGVIPLWRVIAMASAVVLSIPAVVLLWIGGNYLLAAYRAFVPSTFDVGPFAILLAGVLLCGTVAATCRYSSAGSYAFALFWVTLWIALGAFLSSAPPSTDSLLPQWLTRVGVAWALCGFSAAIAVTLLVAGACGRILTLGARRSPTIVLDGGR
ncbi:hypothetical protein SAMN04489806_0095 [Paramicrobacterium humi]|uniref:Uncharacterized protein n=2 Tax=Paramicrobacterium humi TaxID=640635 RepID=A0A1H4INS9_9MICO|nr:hypothetical protein SAMN04489806_0095 [Microbacterium humi]